MEAVYALSRQLHLVFGTVALLTFWWQIARRKGGRSHRRAGWTYAVAMASVLASSVPMIAIGIAHGQLEAGLFLGFLLLITTVAGLEAIFASRHRTNGAWRQGPLFRSFTVAIALYSVLLLGLYVRLRLGVLLFMGLLGLAATLEEVMERRRNKPYVWWVNHMSGVLATGMAVHIAFFSFGARSLFGVGGFSLYAFLVPIAVGQLMAVYFRRTFAGGEGHAQERLAAQQPS